MIRTGAERRALPRPAAAVLDRGAPPGEPHDPSSNAKETR